METIAKYEAVLFDLDGTLVDTAPDMVAVLLQQMQDKQREPIDYEIARATVSNGSLGLVRLGFPDAAADELEILRLDYLDRYQEAVCINSVIFAGLPALLDEFLTAGIPWGIVTNKPTQMTVPLLAALGLGTQAGCAICGDTLPQRKPHPAPMLLACDEIGVVPTRTIYVGDAARDIEAGRAAGMATIAAGYGYITADDDITLWGADVIVNDTRELAQTLLESVNLGRS